MEISPPWQGKHRRCVRALTVLELLVAIAVIAIVAAFLLPVIGAMQESSRNTACAANMRQIVQAVRLYANDHNGMGPPGNNVQQHLEHNGSPGATSLYSTYFYSVWPYVYGSWSSTHHNPDNTVTMNSVKRNIFHCPTRYALYPNATVAPAEMFVENKGSGYAWYDSYAYPINAMAGMPSANPYSDTERAKNPVRVAAMQHPSKTVAIVEGYCWYVTTSQHYYGRYGVLPHKSRANFAFYDGHIEQLRESQIPTKAEARQTIFWSGDNAK